MRSLTQVTILVLLIAAFASRVKADITVPGADGSDGALNVNSSITIDLSAAVTGTWDQAGTGAGVYDPEKWAVVFKYSSVNIRDRGRVYFKNHPSRAPVVWLVTGDVTIEDDGYVYLDGATGLDYSVAESGPGGFRGGAAGPPGQGSGGFGPGGAPYRSNAWGHGGSYATEGDNYRGNWPGPSGPVYGWPRIVPLIGGSGGSPRREGGEWYRVTGGGGGAILIAAQKTLSLTSPGGVYARGGQPGYYAGGGAGGAIRLIADRVTGSGLLRATGLTYGEATGGDGRIRVEGKEISLTDPGDPVYTIGDSGDTAALWPEDTHPTIRVTHIGGEEVPADPKARFDFPKADVALRTQENVTLRLEARNVPTDWVVTIRVTPRSGDSQELTATLVSGDESASVWEATTSLVNGFTAIQARAAKP